jgi:hypothetical protein
LESQNRFPKVGYWRDFQSVSDFVGASRNFNFDFLYERQLKQVKTISTHPISTEFNFRTFKKNVHLVTLSLSLQAVDMVSSGVLPLDQIITHKYPLKDFKKGIDQVIVQFD